jgi:hypothetical protein
VTALNEHRCRAPVPRRLGHAVGHRRGLPALGPSNCLLTAGLLPVIPAFGMQPSVRARRSPKGENGARTFGFAAPSTAPRHRWVGISVKPLNDAAFQRLLPRSGMRTPAVKLSYSNALIETSLPVLRGPTVVGRLQQLGCRMSFSYFSSFSSGDRRIRFFSRLRFLGGRTFPRICVFEIHPC